MQAGLQQPRMECHDADSMRTHGLVEMTSCRGWSYIVERSRWSGAPKPGWVATSAGARCTFVYPLSAPSASHEEERIHRIGVGFLRSYEHMGRVVLRCEYDCVCRATTLDGWWNLSFSPLEVEYLAVTIRRRGYGSCGLRVTVLNATSSGEHKFKVAALFINRRNESDFFGRHIVTQALALKGQGVIADSLEERRRKIRAKREKVRSRRRRKGAK